MPRRNPSAKARYAIDLTILLGTGIIFDVLFLVLQVSLYVAVIASLAFVYACYSVTAKLTIGMLKEERKILPYPAETIVSTVPKITDKLNWSVERKDEASGQFLLKTKTPLGLAILPFVKFQMVGIDVTRITEASSEVHIGSQTPLLADYGQNSRTIKRFFSVLEKALK